MIAVELLMLKTNLILKAGLPKLFFSKINDAVVWKSSLKSSFAYANLKKNYQQQKVSTRHILKICFPKLAISSKGAIEGPLGNNLKLALDIIEFMIIFLIILVWWAITFLTPLKGAYCVLNGFSTVIVLCWIH